MLLDFKKAFDSDGMGCEINDKYEQIKNRAGGMLLKIAGTHFTLQITLSKKNEK
jgi:hypothetical protein